jgi:hypothetical protein
VVVNIDLSHISKIIGHFKFDVAAKRHKNHKNKISHLIISIGYEIEMQVLNKLC